MPDNPTCANDCDFDLPVVAFDDCNPQVNLSEIVRFFIAKKGAAPFSNWLSPTEWISRLSETSVIGDDYIRPITVIGDKPAATSVVKAISNNRKKVVGKDHVINWTIDDVSQANYEFMRGLECGGKFRFWYETAGGMMYGGNDGFLAEIDGNIVNPRGVDEIETIAGTIVWRTKFSPARGISPIFEGDSLIPTEFDTEFEFSADATPAAVGGVTATAGATDAEQLFAFNLITPQSGTPMSMSIKVSAVEELTVDFPSDYEGQYFLYTDKAGVEHTGGQFTDGDVNF